MRKPYVASLVLVALAAGALGGWALADARADARLRGVVARDCIRESIQSFRSLQRLEYEDAAEARSELEKLLGEQVKIAERYTRAVAPTTPGVYRLVSDIAQYVDNRGFPSDSRDAARILAKRLNPALRQSSTQR